MMTISEDDSWNTPQEIRDGLWVFPPNRTSNGSTSWWLGCEPEPLLIDCPTFDLATIQFLKKLSQGRTARILLTNRDAHGKVRDFQNSLGWPVLIQEQEAYLLPGLPLMESFSHNHVTSSGIHLIWTPGPTPGSCVAYAPHPWNVLFCGRLLIPISSDHLAPSLNRRTFHWSRQLKSLEKLREFFPPDQLPELASGAGIGLLGERKLVQWDAWQQS